MKHKGERNLNITENSNKLKIKACAKKNVKNAKKISVSLRECGIVLGAGTNYCPPQQFLPCAMTPMSFFSGCSLGFVDDLRVVEVNNVIKSPRVFYDV